MEEATQDVMFYYIPRNLSIQQPSTPLLRHLLDIYNLLLLINRGVSRTSYRYSIPTKVHQATLCYIRDHPFKYLSNSAPP